MRLDEKTRFWIGVVSASHVRLGVQGGFAQLCHGKAAPLRKMNRGDWLIYYSPRTAFAQGEPLQAFTAIGQVEDEAVYPYRMSDDFVPFRRNIRYTQCKETRIGGLLDRLSFTRGNRNWGYLFRTGHFEIGREDFLTIARCMLSELPEESNGFGIQRSEAKPGFLALAGDEPVAERDQAGP
ncbi:EVE domain-containing protein [Cohnella sp. CFH 77786]|uniref:EVE domain-containing protein n=1 Tax=Cohnella sp. CFH 77786 TaxID=2662265 RepID=UPI001C610A9D|nr:EVE domain-containing protein [Cohnella sp. CFH 77786]MBW5448000.1 EVE domain-containing protein [Cohnella sp. CFH 77786]